MNLADMLEYTAKEFLDDRADLVDGDPDALWSDSYLVRQFNEAQRLLARAAWCIKETGVAPAGRVVLNTGVSIYPLHPSILRVYDATPGGQVLPTGRADDDQLRDTQLLTQRTDDSFGAVEIGMAASLAGGVTALTGVPLAIATDTGWREMRVFPPPSATQNGLVVTLRIARLPIAWLTLDDTDATPEIPGDYHVVLCEYAAGKALTLPNVDGQQRTIGRDLLDKFDLACRDARRDRQRAEMGPSRWEFSSTTALLR